MKLPKLAWIAAAYLALPVNAAEVTWNFVNARFVDGATATGYFTFDSALNGGLGQITAFDITTGGVDEFPGYRYTPATAEVLVSAIYPDSSEIRLGALPASQDRYIYFYSYDWNLSVAGATQGVGGEEFSASHLPDLRYWAQDGGHLASDIGPFVTSVPEPSAYALALAGLAWLGVVFGRRKPV